MYQCVKKSDGEEREQNTGMLIHPLDIFTTPSNHSQGGSSVGLYAPSYITLDLCHVGLDPYSNTEESNLWLYNQSLSLDEGNVLLKKDIRLGGHLDNALGQLFSSYASTAPISLNEERPKSQKAVC